jgi:glutathionyl-hydroquinone reductase
MTSKFKRYKHLYVYIQRMQKRNIVFRSCRMVKLNKLYHIKKKNINKMGFL